ncbi:hypothetical protein HYS54_04245 [Candidatus Micrarchaeota archaeon]|nr:hypothetical protein [Candidatus Micrarchaeota archaeon]
MKAQAAITDALIFMLVSSAAATLLLYVTGLYGSSSTKQLFFSYTNQFTQDSLVTLHYVTDSEGKRFWLEMKSRLDFEKLDDPASNTDTVKRQLGDYLRANYDVVFRPLCSAAGVNCDPARESSLSLCLKQTSSSGTTGLEVCFPPPVADLRGFSVFKSSVKFTDSRQRDWTASLQITR